MDHLAWELVKVEGRKKPGNHTYFPTFGEPKDWRARILEPKGRAKSPTLGMHPNVVDVIERLQPYKGRNRSEAKETSLGRLAWLNNTDKHKTLHASLAYRGDRPPILTFKPNLIAETETEILVRPGEGLYDGIPLVRARGRLLPGIETKPDAQLEVSFGVAFGQREQDRWIGYIDLVGILNDCIGIVGGFDGRFIEQIPGFVPFWED